MIITIIEKKREIVKGLEVNFIQKQRKMSNEGDFHNKSINLLPFFHFNFMKKSALNKRSFKKILY